MGSCTSGYFLCLSGVLTVDSLLLCLSGVMTVDSLHVKFLQWGYWFSSACYADGASSFPSLNACLELRGSAYGSGCITYSCEFPSRQMGLFSYLSSLV
jgi:hypothetical protein